MDCRFSKTNWLQIWTADYGYASLKNLGCPIGPGWMYNVRFWKSPTQVVCVGGSDAIHFPAIMHVHILAKKTHITWQLWWISTFNPQAHFSNHDDDRRNSSQLIDKTTKEKMGSTTKIGNHFMGRNMMPGIHIYLQTKPLSSASQKPRLPPYKSVMLCWQKTWMVKNNRNSRWELLAHASFQLFCHETRMCGLHGLCLLLHKSDKYSFLSGEGKQRRRHKHMVSQLRLLLWQLL